MLIKKIILILLLVFVLTSCSNKEYYQAIKEQNITIQLKAENERLVREDKQRQHQKEMISLIEMLSISTGNTANTNDDFMAAMLLLMVQDKNSMADLAYNLTKKDIQLQQIKAPDSIGDTIQKSTGLLLGVAGISLGIVQSNNMKDIATSGINAAGMSVSGSNNNLAINSASIPINVTASGENSYADYTPSATGDTTSNTSSTTNTATETNTATQN